jgi:hypothetical protein
MAFVVSRFVAPRNCFHNLVGDILEDKILGHGNVLEGLPQTSDPALAFSSEPPKGNSCPQITPFSVCLPIVQTSSRSGCVSCYSLLELSRYWSFRASWL